MAEDFLIRDTAILIPSLEPDHRLQDYVRQLHEKGFQHIVVVDDGSGAEYQPIFRSLESYAAVLHHEENRGKGAALKTGYSWIHKNLSGISGVVTADSDGQHRVSDCIKLVKELRSSDRKALYLGARDFDLPYIPLKSRGGNKITSVIFKLLYGTYLPDTQTGLRAFRAEEIPFMVGIKGDRFEYEMNVLISCSRAGMPIISVPIETVYENNNEGTHFHAVRDSWRIYKIIFGNFFKFMGSSLLCMLIDQALFNLLNLALFSNGSAKKGRYILLSTVIARIVSATMNFSLNKNLVFEKKGGSASSFLKYALLCFGIMLSSAAGTWILSFLGLNSTVAKLITDTLLYVISYIAQDRWVFR